MSDEITDRAFIDHVISTQRLHFHDSSHIVLCYYLLLIFYQLINYSYNLLSISHLYLCYHLSRAYLKWTHFLVFFLITENNFQNSYISYKKDMVQYITCSFTESITFNICFILSISCVFALYKINDI